MSPTSPPPKRAITCCPRCCQMPGRPGAWPHARQGQAESVAEAFRAGEIDVLVATTVIEVGVDAPDATIMVIEHAERFGLAQLHQLRGRVGRGDKPSTCLLLYHGKLGETARARLDVMRQPMTASSSPRKTGSCAAPAIRWG
jgi:transcription-repair coupling factor (superfamily II helicase)